MPLPLWSSISLFSPLPIRLFLNKSGKITKTLSSCFESPPRTILSSQSITINSSLSRNSIFHSPSLSSRLRNPSRTTMSKLSRISSRSIRSVRIRIHRWIRRKETPVLVWLKPAESRSRIRDRVHLTKCWRHWRI